MATQSPTFETLMRTVSNGRDLRPIYILHGKEGYYIDELVKAFERLVPEEDRPYALTNMYAPQVPDAQQVVDVCRTLPMMTERQVVILREAQTAKAEFVDKLTRYAEAPTPSTILVVASRGDVLKGKTFKAAVAKGAGEVFESKEVWPSQIPALVSAYIKQKGLGSEPKAVEMLGEFIGTNLSRLYNEIDKLAQILPAGATVTPEAVERNIGVSKDYNNYELIDAIATRDVARMMRIAAYFEANPKQNPFVMTVSAIFGFFADVLQAYYAKDKSDSGLQAEFKISPYNKFALARLKAGKANYSAFQVIEILDAIRAYDAMSKGSGSRQDPYKMLGDLLYHIATAPGKLPV